MFDLRPANMADACMLFDLANDPGTRVWSKSTDPISQEVHDRWMTFNVLQGYPQHIVMIADNEYGSIGVVRFDAEKRDVMRYRVSIALLPKLRGRGLARGILSEACRLMPENTLLAEINAGNEASRKIFERCGFEQVGKAGSFLQYRREPQA